MDQRTRLTKMLIRQSFVDLLREKHVEQISVSMICSKAQINRSTFYRYYQDVYDLLEQMEQEYLERYPAYISAASSLRDAVEHMVMAVEKNSEFFLLLISDHADQAFVQKMIRKSYHYFNGRFGMHLPAMTPDRAWWLYEFIAHGSIAIILDWIRAGMKQDQQELIDQLTSMIERLMEERA